MEQEPHGPTGTGPGRVLDAERTLPQLGPRLLEPPAGSLVLLPSLLAGCKESQGVAGTPWWSPEAAGQWSSCAPCHPLNQTGCELGVLTGFS